LRTPFSQISGVTYIDASFEPLSRVITAFQVLSLRCSYGRLRRRRGQGDRPADASGIRAERKKPVEVPACIMRHAIDARHQAIRVLGLGEIQVAVES
jgi:hypothetical protein